MKLFARVGPPAGDDNRTADLRRQREINDAIRAGWPQLNLEDLVFHRYVVEHAPSGELFAIHRGERDVSIYSSACAWFLSDAGGAVFLEHPPSGFPKTVAELDAQLARRAARKAAR